MTFAWIGLALNAGGKFLRGIPWQVFVAIAAALLLWLGVHCYHVAIRHAHDTGFSEGVTATKDAFAKAQAKADAAQRARVAATVTKQDTISKDTAHAYNVATDSIDARAARIGLSHAPAARRRAGQSDHPGAPRGASGGACEAPPADGLSWGVALPLMTQAAHDLAQINAVLDWERQQQELDALERKLEAEAPAK